MTPLIQSCDMFVAKTLSRSLANSFAASSYMSYPCMKIRIGEASDISLVKLPTQQDT